ncbi:galaxin [Biomphalaria glabrata]|nr:galaxin [Biomphalaria glabrata]
MFKCDKPRVRSERSRSNINLSRFIFGIIQFGIISFQCQYVSSQNLCNVNGKYEEYDRYFKICCKNKLQHRLQGQECCGTKEFYYKKDSICCNNKVLDRFVCPRNHSGCSSPCSQNDVLCNEQLCCGKKNIIRSESLCCFDREIKLTEQQKKDSDFISCCNETHLYDLRSQICCNKKVYRLDEKKQLRCCGDKTYLPEKNKCLRVLNTSGKPDYVIRGVYEDVCGDDQIYNKRYNKCCNGILYAEPDIDPSMIWEPNPEFRCCDHLLMNSKEKCCRQHLYYHFPTHTIPNNADLDCCGEGFYNKTIELCKNGTKIKKQFDKELCGYEYYDPSIEGCCEFTIYSKDKFKCCKGDKKTVVSLDKKCCNGEGIDASYICCDDLLPAKRKGMDDECCYNEDKTMVEAYSRQSGQRCVSGFVVEGYPEHTEPCGHNLFYYPSKEICCNDNVYDNSWKCCDGHAYSLQKQTCCFSKLYSLPSSESSCCNVDRRAYRSNDTSNPCLSPCGTTFFNTNTEVCCEDKVYSEKRNFECCGNHYINRHRNLCCRDKYPYKNRGHMECCRHKVLHNARKPFCHHKKTTVIPYYTSKLCQPKIFQSFQKTKHLACNTNYGLSGMLERVIVERTSVPKTDMLIMNVTVNSWLNFGSSSSRPSKKEKHIQFLIFNIHIQRLLSHKCPKYLQTKGKIMIFFNSKPLENTVTITHWSNVFLSQHTPKNEKEILSCKAKSSDN